MTPAGATPGPWFHRPHLKPNRGWVVAAPQHPLADVLDTADKCGEANARLIASAPDLLAACEAAIAALTQPAWKSSNPAVSILLGDAKFATDSLRAAVTKAKGE